MHACQQIHLLVFAKSLGPIPQQSDVHSHLLGSANLSAIV